MSKLNYLVSKSQNIASAGNRTRAARVAGEHSTTEPPMLRFGCIASRIPDPASMLARSPFLREIDPETSFLPIGTRQLTVYN